jgi:hypothetical protein
MPLKRLKSKLLAMEPNTATYTEMYNGSISIADPRGGPSIHADDPVYYNDQIGFEITGTHKLAQDKPTVKIIIPYDQVIQNLEGEMPLKRLKYYLHGMQNDTATYKEMYDFVKDDLELATYNLKDPSEYEEHRKINFIAQDVLCNEDQTENKVGNLIVLAQKCMEDQEVLQYDTGNYISVLAGALKQAINKIEELEKEILDLKSRA